MGMAFAFSLHCLGATAQMPYQCSSKWFSDVYITNAVLQPHREWISKSLRWTSRQRDDFHCSECLGLLNSWIESLWRPDKGNEELVEFIKENMSLWTGRSFYYKVHREAISPVKICSQCGMSRNN